MAVNDNIIAASVGVFGIVGLLLLFLVQRSKKKRKRKSSVVVASHVEGENAKPPQEEKLFPHQKLSNERIIYNYLESNYWSKADMHKRISIPDDITQRHFKNVNRITRTTPPILVIYSARSVWELGLSERAESGLKENFSFVMRGPEAPSQRKRRKKIEYVLDDMIQFREVYGTDVLVEYKCLSPAVCAHIIPVQLRQFYNIILCNHPSRIIHCIDIFLGNRLKILQFYRFLSSPTLPLLIGLSVEDSRIIAHTPIEFIASFWELLQPSY